MSTHKVRSITLELVRSGESHNQLLSPLTPYLALCGSHNPEVVHVPWEHAKFESMSAAISSAGSGEQARERLAYMAEDIIQMLLGIRSLTKELSEAENSSCDVLELRLILSASELSALPFELVAAPPAFGIRTRLSEHRGLVIMRQARRVATTTIDWPDRPRLLVAIASPDGVAPVPDTAHVLALCNALSPWQHVRTRGQILRDMHILPGASLEGIAKICRREQFTHVHILAHGVRIGRPTQPRHGLALHRRPGSNEMDKVDAGRLACALGHSREKSRSGDPLTVVTLATCDSGRQGTILTPGGSLAHELHEEGIPFVVASQFPLSYPGSAIMVESFYKDILWGTDPRRVLERTRRRLFMALGDRRVGASDWASLTAYGSLPGNLRVHLRRSQRRMAQRAIDAELAKIYPFLNHPADETPPPVEDLGEIRARLENNLRRLRDSLDEDSLGIDRARVYGYEGALEKRYAETLHYRATHDDSEHRPHGEAAASLHFRRILRRAASAYDHAFSADGTQSWAQVQATACRLMEGDPPCKNGQLDDLERQVRLAREQQWCSEYEFHRDRFEISIMKIAIGQMKPDQLFADASCGVITQRMHRDPDSFESRSVYRQLYRFQVFTENLELGAICETIMNDARLAGVTGRAIPITDWRNDPYGKTTSIDPVRP